ncbi:MAG: glycosyltransferase family 39 protein, partial [Anaerolineae bacterium]|nr:glycosyltransferase family 39 protein [Anaerolineae bacterium]
MQESNLRAAEPRRTGNVIVAVALVALMLIGGYFRFVGQNWDDFTSLHPDERFLMQVSSGIGGPTTLSYADPGSLTPELAEQQAMCMQRYPATNGIGGYFDAACSPYNPQNVGFGTFVYGTLPTFSARAVAEFTAALTGDQSWLSFYPMHLMARLVSGLSEMMVIVVVFSMGLRLHGKWVGLLAAALYSLTVFSIQQAHFGTSDPMANLFTALSILFAICVQRDGKLRDYVFFGIAFGMALASRINLLPLVGLIFVATAIRLLPMFGRGLAGHEREAQWTQSAVGIILAGVATLIVFRLFNPYAFNGPGIFGIVPNSQWLDEVGKARYFISGDWDAPPNWQWIARPRYLFALWNMVAYGMGLALGVTAVLATIAGLWRLVRGKPGALANAVPLAWIVAYFGFMGGQWVMTMRYYLPLYAAMSVMAAWGLAALVRGPLPNLRHALTGMPGITRRRIGWAAIIGVLGFSLLWATMFSGVYRNLSNRVAASYWFWEQVPGDFAMRIDDAPPDTPLLNIALPNSFTPGEFYDLVGQATQLYNGVPVTYDFTALAGGTVTSIHAPHLGDIGDDTAPEVLRFTISHFDGDTPTEVASASLTAHLDRSDHPLGNAYDILLDAPLTVTKGERYRFEVVLDQGEQVVSGGSIVTWEGDWDDALPVKTCTPSDGLTLADNPAPGRFSAADCNGRDAYWALLGGGYKLQMVNNDSAANRERMLELLGD